jgi:predicted transcriptional regulator
MPHESELSARERQIMDVIYSLGEASVTQVLEALANPPSRSAIRALLRILEEKGHVRHRTRGREYIFRPSQPRNRAERSAVQHILNVFFDGSLEKAVAVHLSNPKASISEDELKRLEALIRDARKKGH